MNPPVHLPGPITGPSTWRAGELFQRDDWLVELSDDELSEFDSALRFAESANHAADDLDLHGFPLQRSGQLLDRVQDHLERGSGACLIRRIPVKTYSEQQQKLLFAGISAHVGTALSQSAAGQKIFSVRDEGWGEKDPRARGPNTRKKLSFHTDRCDVIGFLCLHQAMSGGANQLVSSVTLYNEMRQRHPDLLRVLMEPYWYQRHNVDTANSQPYCCQPIFSFQDGHFAASYLRVLIERAYQNHDVPEMTSQQRKALDTLDEIAGDPSFHVSFRQEPGDLMFLNNWTTLHRRESFVDSPELGLRRHLLRIWLAVPNSRPLHPLFEANYGATAAGAIRGGMRAL